MPQNRTVPLRPAVVNAPGGASAGVRTQAPGTALPELVSYLESLPEPHILFDRGYRILAANAAYREQFGGADSVVGRTCYAVSHRFDAPCDQSGESCPLARARVSGQRERVLHLHHTPHGEAYVNIELTPLRDATGEQAYFIERMEPLRVAHSEPAAAGLIGRSPAFQALLSMVARAGPSQASVLLLGESGTGKELVALAVHEASARAARPLVVVDCASLPESLFESELFGHERGAFTGAHAARPGLVESASGGTLFLDEVGDIPLPMQVKLLRLIENGTYRRVGSTELRRADVRLVSATHRDLPAMVARGEFRVDLYHRLSTFPIRLPPLRERGEDVVLIARALLARVAPGRRLQLTPPALALLRGQRFEGNVRELRNVLERAALLADGEVLDADVLGRALALGRVALHPTPEAAQPGPAAGPARATPAAAGLAPARRWRARDVDDAALRAALAVHAGSNEALARALGISLRTLYRRLAGLRQGPEPAHPQG